MIINANALQIPLADKSVHMIVTSPPYWGLRNYQVSGQLGLERTPEEYVANMVAVFRECWRVLRDDGTLWLNIGDSYASAWASGRRNIIGNGSRDNRVDRMGDGLKEKDLVGIPWRLAFALQADGWYLRSDIIWSKPNPMPESVTDRPTKSHEYLFLLAKRERYYYDAEAIKEEAEYTDGTLRFSNKNALARNLGKPGNGNENKLSELQPDRPAGRNRRSVWTIPTAPYSTGVKIDHWRRVSLDAVSDGMTHIVLPSCPIHAGLFDQVANDFCGEYEGDLLTRIKHTYYHLAQDRVNEHHNKPGNNGHSDANPDFLNVAYSPFVIDHSNEIHRMALDLGSNAAYIPFFEIADRIDDRLELLASFVRHLCIFGNNILPGDLGARLQDRTPHRIVDKFSLPIPSDCECLYYEHYTIGAEHFATFPPALVEPCIKAGTSERGVCPKCGKGWMRIIDKEIQNRSHRGTNQNNDRNDGGLSCNAERNILTLGWKPSCTCGQDNGGPLEPIPAIVFDPFVGSGTTVKVAYDLGRRGVGLDLSLEYLDGQARNRIHNGHTGRLL